MTHGTRYKGMIPKLLLTESSKAMWLLLWLVATLARPVPGFAAVRESNWKEEGLCREAGRLAWHRGCGPRVPRLLTWDKCPRQRGTSSRSHRHRRKDLGPTCMSFGWMRYRGLCAVDCGNIRLEKTRWLMQRHFCEYSCVAATACCLQSHWGPTAG